MSPTEWDYCPQCLLEDEKQYVAVRHAYNTLSTSEFQTIFPGIAAVY